MRVYLPQEKIQKICHEATHLAKQSLLSIRELAAFVGRTNAAKQAIVTRDYINNYVITFVIDTYMYACISLVVLCDYIVVLWTVSVTHVTLVSEADSYLPRTATN